jgi:hypothetical protein
MSRTEPDGRRPGLGHHRGRCGHRARCYRPACRDRFGDYATVEVLADVVRFYCHVVEVPVDALVLEMLGSPA